MHIVIVSYTHVPEQVDPHQWIKRLQFLTTILVELAKSVEVSYVGSIDWEGELEIDGVCYIFRRRPSGLNHVVRTLRPSAVIVQGFQSSAKVIALAARLARDTMIFVQHRADKPGGWLQNCLRRLADRYIDGYLFVSKATAHPWLQKGIISQNKVHEIPGASSAFRITDQAAARQLVHIERGTVYLWVGRLDANKDPLTVIRAFITFVGRQPAAHLYMIYQSNDLLPEITSLLVDTTLADHIHLMGRIPHPQLESWYNAADFIICSSFHEGGNIAVIEAMSCGCIPIVSDIPSFKLHTGNGNVGFVFQPGNKEQLLQVLLLSSTVQQEIEKQKVAAHFRDHLSAESIAGRILRLVNIHHR